MKRVNIKHNILQNSNKSLEETMKEHKLSFLQLMEVRKTLVEIVEKAQKMKKKKNVNCVKNNFLKIKKYL